MTDLERLRQQCRIDFEDPATDSLLLSLQKQGEAFVLSRVNRTREELVEIGGGEWPEDLRLAVLVFVADHYANPEGRERPNLTRAYLVRPDQRLTGGQRVISSHC